MTSLNVKSEHLLLGRSVHHSTCRLTAAPILRASRRALIPYAASRKQWPDSSDFMARDEASRDALRVINRPIARDWIGPTTVCQTKQTAGNKYYAHEVLPYEEFDQAARVAFEDVPVEDPWREQALAFSEGDVSKCTRDGKVLVSLELKVEGGLDLSDPRLFCAFGNLRDPQQVANLTVKSKDKKTREWATYKQLVTGMLASEAAYGILSTGRYTRYVHLQKTPRAVEDMRDDGVSYDLQLLMSKPYAHSDQSATVGQAAGVLMWKAANDDFDPKLFADDNLHYFPKLISAKDAGKADEARFSYNDINLGDLLGTGGFGWVRQCTWEGKLAAVKMAMPSDDVTAEDASAALEDEMHVLQEMQGLGLPIPVPMHYGLMELPYAELPALVMSRARGVELSEVAMTPAIAQAVTAAYAAIHSQRLLHADVATCNILVDVRFGLFTGPPVVTIVDFGMGSLRSSPDLLEDERQIVEDLLESLGYSTPQKEEPLIPGMPRIA